jgi:hypothetical protein
MKKVLASLLIIAIVTVIIFTTIGSLADLQKHLSHLVLLSSLALLSLGIVLQGSVPSLRKATIKTRYLPFLVMFLLFGFALIRVMPCHMLVSSPQDLAHASAVSHPCCSATTSAVSEVTVAPVLAYGISSEQDPLASVLSIYLDQTSNKSPPIIVA